MHNYKKYLFVFIGFLLLLSCNADIDSDLKGYTQKIIVEGRIEEGRGSVVYIGLNIPLWKEIDSTTILDHVIRTAKVTLSDGEKSEILTSKWDLNNFPPYVYKSTEIMGEYGKTYDLKIEYSGYVLNSRTSIPTGFEIKSIQLVSEAHSEMEKVKVDLDLGADADKSFRLFYKKNTDSHYAENKDLFNIKFDAEDELSIVFQPSVELDDLQRGDTLDLKICAIDRQATAFFKDVSFYASRISYFLVNEPKPLNSNISHPGFGVWYGCVTRKASFVMP